MLAGQCVGDCNGDNEVTIDELMAMVAIALGEIPVEDCLAGDRDGDGTITIDEIVAAIDAALFDCPHVRTPVPEAVSQRKGGGGKGARPG